MDNTAQTNSPLDDIIARVDSYLENPKLVTPDTLTQLKSELEDLKSYLDTEETGEGEPSKESMPMSMHGEKPSLVIAIGHAMKGKKQ